MGIIVTTINANCIVLLSESRFWFPRKNLVKLILYSGITRIRHRGRIPQNIDSLRLPVYEGTVKASHNSADRRTKLFKTKLNNQAALLPQCTEQISSLLLKKTLKYTEALKGHWEKKKVVKNSISFPRIIISFERIIISFERIIISFPRIIISFERIIISFERIIISFERIII